jgi:antitoxin VapB
MASLYIKDAETAALVERVAKRSGMTKTALVRELTAAREAELDRAQKSRNPRDNPREWLKNFWQKHGITPSEGLSTDKAFFDDLSGDL